MIKALTTALRPCCAQTCQNSIK